MIKHIFSDMDGTLLNSSGNINPKNAQMIRNNEIPFTLVSARSPFAMNFAIEQLNLTDYQIAFNGGLIFRNEIDGLKVIDEKYIDLLVVKKLIKIMSSKFPNINISLFDQDNWYVDKYDEKIKYEYSFTKQKIVEVEYENLFKNNEKIKIFKIMMITNSNDESIALGKYLQKFGETSVSVTQSGLTYMEITNVKANKADAVKFIGKLEGLKSTELAAFGDNYNDISMLEYVGHSFGMGNAVQDVKNIVDTITKSNDEDGVGYGITNLL